MILSDITKRAMIFVTALICMLSATESHAACKNNYAPIGQVNGPWPGNEYWFHSTDYDTPNKHRVRITCYAGRSASSIVLWTWDSLKFAPGQRCEAAALNFNTCGNSSGLDVIFWRMP